MNGKLSLISRRGFLRIVGSVGLQVALFEHCFRERPSGVESGSLHEPITDGIVDIPRYLASSPKILWILKEPWEDLKEGEAGGGWSLTKLAEGLVSNRDSFAIMAYVTYSVFHGFPRYDAIPYVADSPDVANALQHIAYVNISKLPGQSTSSAGLIHAAYDKNREILARQIKAIAPDVIIGGGTLHLFFDDLHLSDDMFSKNTSTWFCSRDGCLYIQAYHPNQRTVRQSVYCDDIVDVIKARFQGVASSRPIEIPGGVLL